ncbi:nicotinamide-nucleotide adenylyltransferase [Candidatus Marsarchaeota G2 archaeon ECH_B_SAG-F08]|jgi:nicotinamide-nucleotide adenylyltransferase|uniref:Nicotinamide-nucleotide adenylyltransferase n=5 Tax=Candidatus Marsarchaeota TaxID=1978152 RepID=A0A2R6AHW0_9ARCH|nr:MAG: nicotinamide-nucleotide adenylyltransferase [Candidatus Marsarchaeota G1 archaeon OSP_D]PSN85965.1 MAG: nicotinamide-nucleotide adenylyltransferase [Candidatus Marsarchaeota G1 archaeon BE_D]PSN88454.1 MAG: nicotinamide-nucleotide adenylyltransferase [Candidatus Marsarchaeota G1 archaeon OSP_C]PSN98084.1 MAG: nicotinamide-nucleotide adenylyltransferase [Candidatus Marsarchaeota G2 archaeon ECH_B_SAG-F08]PSO04825.1 MAG: nicotinamide-nucleotide adenylyltransferase [Candidatus Marsarchaeot
MKLFSSGDRRAILIGRFQPLHTGHIYAIKQILDENQEIVIAIGSAQASHTLENPLTAGERVYMIHKTLVEEKLELSRIYIITVPDIQYNSIWPMHVKTYSPPFSIVYTGNSLVKTLFEELGYHVKRPNLYLREKCSGTNIRKLMLVGNPEWRNYVPKTVAIIAEELKLEERLKNIATKLD